MSVFASINNWLDKLKIGIFQMLKLQSGPVLKLYTGYGNGETCVIYGHCLSLAPVDRIHHRQGFIKNTLALLRLFFVKPLNNVNLVLQIGEDVITTTSQKDGFLKFEWKAFTPMPFGVYTCLVKMQNKLGVTISEREGKIIVPAPGRFACISDIDDTFLISHSGNLRKRLFVLFTENAHSRRPFEGAVKHYRLLRGDDDGDPSHNTFFYVSSSEWNLYSYIREFIQQNKLPEGIMLLNQIKTFSGLLKTGQSNHQGKFFRITRILEMFPQQKFILLGDDSQKDPDIYNAITKNFPANFLCVYIRRLGTPQKEHVVNIKKEIEARGIKFLYFAHSAEAIKHSLDAGYIVLDFK